MAKSIQEREEKEKEALHMQLQQLKQKRKDLIDEIKETHQIARVLIGAEPYVCMVVLKGVLQTYPKSDKYIVPLITINGTSVPTEAVDSTTLRCQIHRAVTAEDKELVFGTGRYHQYCVANPYYFDPHADGAIEWQCEGHKHERRVRIAGTCFPYAHSGVQYNIELYVHTTSRGMFSGKFDPEKQALIIQLDKKVHRNDCEGKKAWIRLDYGKRNKIMLPSPSIILN